MGWGSEREDALAKGFAIDDPALVADQDHGAGNIADIDLFPDRMLDSGKARIVHPYEGRMHFLFEVRRFCCLPGVGLFHLITGDQAKGEDNRHHFYQRQGRKRNPHPIAVPGVYPSTRHVC